MDFGLKAIPIENGVDEWILDVPWQPMNYAMYSGRIERYKTFTDWQTLLGYSTSNIDLILA